MTWCACYLMLAALGLFGFYLTVEGLGTGAVTIFSKRVSGTIEWSSSPFLFSFTVLAWFGCAYFLLRLAVSGWRDE